MQLGASLKLCVKRFANTAVLSPQEISEGVRLSNLVASIGTGDA